MYSLPQHSHSVGVYYSALSRMSHLHNGELVTGTWPCYSHGMGIQSAVKWLYKIEFHGSGWKRYGSQLMRCLTII